MKRIFRNDTGAAVIEFALAAPMLFMMIFGISQIGIVFSANAGLQHAVAEGARVAAVYHKDGPADADIVAAVTDSRFGLKPERLTGPTLNWDPDDRYVDIALSYRMPLNFVFVSPNVTISESRRVYLSMDSEQQGGTGGGGTGNSSAGGDGSTSTGGDGSSSGGSGSGGDTGSTTTSTTSGGHGGGNSNGNASSGNGNGSSGGCRRKCG